VRDLKETTAYISPADHVCSSPVKSCEHRILKDVVWEVDAKRELKEIETQPNATVFAAQMLEGLHVKNFPALP